MLYKGKIDELKKMVVSDPSYGEDVWCRYERNAFPKAKGWDVQMDVSESKETVDGFELSGVEFSLMIAAQELNGRCRLGEEGNFFCPMSVKIGKPAEVGMDTACVALGINERADEIKTARGDWQPDCALKTLTDGFFGNVHEGKLNGAVVLVVASGYLDDDTGYTVQDVVDYLVDAFEIKNLELVQEKAAVNEKIAKAEAEKDDYGPSFEERLKDAYDRSGPTGSNRGGNGGSDDGPGELPGGKDKHSGYEGPVR